MPPPRLLRVLAFFLIVPNFLDLSLYPPAIVRAFRELGGPLYQLTNRETVTWFL